MKQRLDTEMVHRGVVATRSQAENYIKLGSVRVNHSIILKPGFLVSKDDTVVLEAKERYVSRAGLKLASVAENLKIEFRNKIVLDVGSSTGGFTDYALQHGAQHVIAVDVGSNQLHESLRNDERIELHEQTDIRNFATTQKPDVIIIDVSFISLREILPYLRVFANENTAIIPMVKPQFEAGKADTTKGVIKNDKIRRQILKDFENWVQKLYVIVDKADSEISGAKGNQERFYLLRKV